METTRKAYIVVKTISHPIYEYDIEEGWTIETVFDEQGRILIQEFYGNEFFVSANGRIPPAIKVERGENGTFSNKFLDIKNTKFFKEKEDSDALLYMIIKNFISLNGKTFDSEENTHKIIRKFFKASLHGYDIKDKNPCADNVPRP